MPACVQRVGRRAHLGPAAGCEPRVGRPEHDRVVAPGVGEAERREMALVDERVCRHDLDRGDAERGQVRDRGGMGEAGESSAHSFGNCRIEAGEAAQVELVDDERLGRDPFVTRLAGGRRAGDRLGRVRAAVFAEGEHRGVETERPVEGVGVWVGEQLGGVEAMAPRRIERPLNAKAVVRAGAKPGATPRKILSAPRTSAMRDVSRSPSNRQSRTPSAFGRSSAASSPCGDAVTPSAGVSPLMPRFARSSDRVPRSASPGRARIRPTASR